MSTLQTGDWAHLPPELLETIAADLTDIVDRVRFSSVCSQWRSAANSTASNLSPQIPWLLLPKDSNDTSTAAARRFFCLSHNRIFTLRLPETRKTRTNKIFPSPDGWIVSPLGIETLALLNPFTRSSIPLPPLPLTESRRKNIGAFVLRKAKVFESNLVTVLFPDGRDLLFCRPGESSWRRLDTASCYPNSDFAHHKGRFFVINSTMETIWVFDVETLGKVAEIPLVSGDKVCDYLVELFSGELLMLRRATGDVGRRFRLFRLEENEGEVKWMKVSGIGDNVLFVDGVQAMAFDARKLNGCRRNCIYFVDYLPGPKQKGMMVFDLGKGRTEEVPLFSYAFSGYWGKAIWVVPSLHQQLC